MTRGTEDNPQTFESSFTEGLLSYAVPEEEGNGEEACDINIEA